MVLSDGWLTRSGIYFVKDSTKALGFAGEVIQYGAQLTGLDSSKTSTLIKGEKDEFFSRFNIAGAAYFCRNGYLTTFTNGGDSKDI